MKRFDQINVIPFIDIMLVLLAIVLTTATFISQGKLQIKLPKASHNNESNQQLEPVQLAIDSELKLYYQQQIIDPEELKKKLALLEKDTAISIKVDQTIPFQEFVKIVDMLKQEKLEKLTIVTQKTQ